MGTQVTLVPEGLVLRVLKALKDYQDPQAGRVLQEMLFLPGQVLTVHLATLGLWGEVDLLAFLEAQGLQVSLFKIFQQLLVNVSCITETVTVYFPFFTVH